MSQSVNNSQVDKLIEVFLHGEDRDFDSCAVLEKYGCDPMAEKLKAGTFTHRCTVARRYTAERE